VRQPESRKFRTMKRARALRRRLTNAEAILWSRLRHRQLEGFKFRRQHPIGPYIADFACPQAMLVVEVDGDTHGSSEELARDRRRTAYLGQCGWTVVRCYNVDVYENLDGVLTQIAEAITPQSELSSPCNGEGDREAVEGRRAIARRCPPKTPQGAESVESIKETKPAKGERKPQ
jgi:very-short-patch-repair endonuclease